jgi:hypothetical protein
VEDRPPPCRRSPDRSDPSRRGVDRVSARTLRTSFPSSRWRRRSGGRDSAQLICIAQTPLPGTYTCASARSSASISSWVLQLTWNEMASLKVKPGPRSRPRTSPHPARSSRSSPSLRGGARLCRSGRPPGACADARLWKAVAVAVIVRPAEVHVLPRNPQAELVPCRRHQSRAGIGRYLQDGGGRDK